MSGRKRHIEPKPGVFPPTVALFALVKGQVPEGIALARTADLVVRVEKAERTSTLPAEQGEAFAGGRFFEHEVEHPAKLGPVLQGSSSPYDFDALQGFCGRGIVTFGVSEGIGADVVPVLPRIEIAAPVGAQSPPSDAELDAGTVAFPNVQPADPGIQLPGVVGGGIGLYVAQYDDLALPALVNSHAFHRPQAGNAKSALLCCLYRNRVQVFGEWLQGYLEQERLLCNDHRALPGLLPKTEHREHLWTERDFSQLKRAVSSAVGHFVEFLDGDYSSF